MTWFDAHLDLACLAVLGRDMRSDRCEVPEGKMHPGCVTLPALRRAGVRFALATVFIEQVDAESARLTAEQYRLGDVEGAVRRARAQLEVYETWRDAGEVTIDLPACLAAEPGVGAIRGGMGVSEVVPSSAGERARAAGRDAPGPHLGILIEGADALRVPEELEWWAGRGVVACSLAWWRGSRFASGNNGEPVLDDTGQSHAGLTPMGRELVTVMDALGVVHDLSHLSDVSTHEVLSLTDMKVIASHSNCRELLGGELGGKNQRHLRDETIREIGRRGGVVGLNLFGRFLAPAGNDGEARPATIDDAVAHVERVCEIMGHRSGVGLGSDMDGGFNRYAMCRGIEGPEDLPRLSDALKTRGWTDAEIRGFTHENWAGFWAGVGARRRDLH